MNEQLKRIAKKIAQKGKSLNPPLSEDNVAEFEAQHGTVLPNGFRRFILEIGNGGSGPPTYRLVSLGSNPRVSDAEEDIFWQRLPNVIHPFPFTKPWIWESGDDSDEGTMEQTNHGCIFLGHDGCGMNWVLIVTGPERGNIWMLTGEGITPTEPKRDFLTWYEEWLDGRANFFCVE